MSFRGEIKRWGLDTVFCEAGVKEAGFARVLSGRELTDGSGELSVKWNESLRLTPALQPSAERKALRAVFYSPGLKPGASTGGAPRCLRQCGSRQQRRASGCPSFPGCGVFAQGLPDGSPLHLRPDHSCRSAVVGSTPLARRAGKKPARLAARVRTTAEPMNVHGSRGFNP